MINPTEIDERRHLEHVKESIQDQLDTLNIRVRRYAKEVQEQKDYLWESRGDMDHAEKVSTRQIAEQIQRSGETALEAHHKLERLLAIPYFGRFDFKKSEEPALPVYVGVHNFVDDSKGTHLIYDWRAPICSLFYDFELGPAHYIAPTGTIRGEMALKRQFRIRDGEMAFMLESGLNIMDDVLQEELAHTSDDRMKNIVATIQRDQNAIIRNEDADVLIIQGVAGSGKTSIALHRVAFLLYRHKESLSSKDILIISPNKVFGDFIADVLPELGESPIAEVQMEQLANELLDGKVKFQTFFDQTAALLEKNDDAMKARIAQKASLDFLKQLERYVAHVEESRFCATDIWIANRLVPKFIIEIAFAKRAGMPIRERLQWTCERIEQNIWQEYRYEVTGKDRAEIRSLIRKMYRKSTLRALYKEMFDWMGCPELFKPGSKLEYADLFPLIYLKMRLEGIRHPHKEIKHLVVDEMQDYTPVQYAVLSRLFPCEKTILGDIHQSINPLSASSADTIGTVFSTSEIVTLKKSYRSSFEITTFAMNILGNTDTIAIERHNSPPRILSLKSRAKEIDAVKEAIREFEQSSHNTLGIICKTAKQATRLHKTLQESFSQQVHLLTPQSTAFVTGVVVCNAHLAKGLEFDRVVVPEVTEKNYVTDMDRHLLYVACTRAMHCLTLTHTGKASKLLSSEM